MAIKDNRSLNSAGKLIFKERGDFGEITVIESNTNGAKNRILFLDEIRQCGTDMPIAGIAGILNAFNRSNLKVARVGNACGLALAKITNHPKISKIDAIEINPLMLEAMKFFDEATDRARENPKVNFIIADAYGHLSETDKRYDLIDVWGRAANVPYSERLYSKDFFDIVESRLAPDGIFSFWVAQTSTPESKRELRRRISEVFNYVYIYEPKEEYLVAVNRPLSHIKNLL